MKDKLIVLAGPTGIGKTEISLDLAKRLNAEVVSADSMQIYQYMDIGTAKIKEDEMRGIQHHLLDIIKPDEDFTVSDYRKEASLRIKEINQRGKIPLLVGGTGLYINSLVYKLNFTQVKANEAFRIRVEEEADKFGNQYIHDKLREIDPESADKIATADRKRIVRALEIIDSTGKKMSEYNKDFRKETNKYDLRMICLDMDRQDLYEKINNRVDKMVEKGLIEEVKKILDMGYSKELVSLQAIGYKEIISYLEGEISLDKSLEIIKQSSRNYAKRQLTWFRRDKRFIWFNLDSYSSRELLLDHIIEKIDI